jgi:hypothetical protein
MTKFMEESYVDVYNKTKYCNTESQLNRVIGIVNCTMQLLVLKLKKCKGKKVKDQKVKKLSLSFFYSKVEIKSECFNF